MRREKVCLLGLVVFLAFCYCLSEYSLGQEAAPPAKTKEPQAKPQPEKIVAAPRNIKERSRIYVFIGWMWASIAVLIYFLWFKIKEADRLYKIKYFAPD